MQKQTGDEKRTECHPQEWQACVERDLRHLWDKCHAVLVRREKITAFRSLLDKEVMVDRSTIDHHAGGPGVLKKFAWATCMALYRFLALARMTGFAAEVALAW